MSFFAELKRRNVLRVAVAYLVLAWLLVQVGSILLPTFHAPAWVMQVLVLVLAAGFLVTLFFSWAYELTPDGLRRESEVDRSQSIAHHTARKLDIGVIVLLVAVAAITVLVQRRAPTPASTPQATTPAAVVPVAASTRKDAPTSVVDSRPSVAVLPFVNMSALAENEYFADGLSETLLNMLAQVSGLKVAARTSAFAFKGSKTDIREIARTLGVNTVLEGSVQRAGERVRITAQLIEAKDGSHLWSRNYDRKLDDIFAIQDEIAKEVAAELTRSLLGTSNKGPAVASLQTNNADAYDLYLRGLQQLNLDSYGSLPMAERHLKEAIAKDPGFSEARIALANTYYHMGKTGLIPHSEAAQRGRPFLAPLLQGTEAQPVARSYDAVLQWLAASPDSYAAAYAMAREVIAEALKQAPNVAELYGLGAIVFNPTDRNAREALDLLERGLAIDPLSSTLLNVKARALRELRRHDDSLATYTRLQELQPDAPAGYEGMALTYLEVGRYADAVKWMAQAAAVDKEDHELAASTGEMLLAMGLPDDALQWLRRAESRNAAGAATQKLAIVHAALTGQTQRAIDLAREVLRERRSNRAGLYSAAVFVYLTLMREADRMDEAYAFIKTISPGVLEDPPRVSGTEQDIQIEYGVAESLMGRLPPEKLVERARTLSTKLATLFPEFKPEEGYNGVLFAGLRGETRKAAEMMVELIEGRKDLPRNWRLEFRSPLLAAAMREPDMVAAIETLEADIAKQVLRYREMLAAGEIAQP